MLASLGPSWEYWACEWKRGARMDTRASSVAVSSMGQLCGKLLPDGDTDGKQTVCEKVSLNLSSCGRADSFPGQRLHSLTIPAFPLCLALPHRPLLLQR